MVLHGPLGVLFGIVFVALWAHAMFCALMVVRNSQAKVTRWFSTFWPASTLTSDGLRYRRRFYITVAMAFALVALAFLVLPS